MRLRAYLLPGIIVTAVQFGLLALSFPLSELFSNKPLTTVDHAFHLYQILVSLDLADLGKIVGYDPQFAAGYIGGVTFNASAKVPAFFAWALQDWISAIVVYKLYVFLAALIAPLGLVVAAYALRLHQTATWLASLFGLLLWWASVFHWDHTVGMVSFVLLSFLVIPFCAALYRTLSTGSRWPQSIALGLCGAGLFFLHPFFPLAVASFVLILFAVQFKHISIKQSAPHIAVIALLSLLPNWLWLSAMISAPSLADAAISPYQKIVDIKIILLEITGQWRSTGMGAKLYPLLALLAIWAAWGSTSEVRRLVFTYVFLWFALVLFAALGAAVPGMGSLQPNRFSAMAYLFLVIPAAIGATILLQSIREAQRATWAARLTLLALIPLATLVLFEFTREASDAQTRRYGKPPPEVRGLGASNTELLLWLKMYTNTNGRILFETSLARIHDGAHIAGLLARFSDREFIGGPYPFQFFAGYWDGYVFGQPINDIGNEAFQSYLALYNVGWIVAHSPVSQRYLGSLPFVHEVSHIGDVRIYTVDGSRSYFMQGQGSVVIDKKSRIFHLQNLTPGNPVVLKYHYAKGMQANDGSPVIPVYFAGDPQAFIKVVPQSESLDVAF